jgi:hypothetical protein
VTYTPEYVFVIWLGYTHPGGKPGLDELGIDSTLARVVDISLTTETEFDGWQTPDGIVRLEVCTPSGMLPGDACPQTNYEYFLIGTEPTETDTLYQRYPIDMETGRLATVFTDPSRVVQQVFFNPPDEELAWATQAGYPLVPGNYTVFQDTKTSGKAVIVNPVNFATVNGKIGISGFFATDGFISYRMDLGVGLAPSQWLQVGSPINTLPQKSNLGTLDTTRYANGLYTLRIQILRQGNLIENNYVVIRITNPTEGD